MPSSRSPTSMYGIRAMDIHTKRQKRQQLWELQRGLCAICGKPLTPDDTTFDHVKPVREFVGRYHLCNALSNLQLAHRLCNEGRHRK